MEASAGRARARGGRLRVVTGRVGLPWAGWCRLSSSCRRSRDTSSCSSRMAWLGWGVGQKQRQDIQCTGRQPPPEGRPDARGLSLSSGPRVQLCRQLILELPCASIFLATYLDSSLSSRPCAFSGQSSTSFEVHPTPPTPYRASEKPVAHCQDRGEDAESRRYC